MIDNIVVVFSFFFMFDNFSFFLFFIFPCIPFPVAMPPGHSLQFFT